VSQLETSVAGNPLRTINAAGGNENYQLPSGFASGRAITVRREDSGSSGNTVVISVPSGATLDGVVDGTITLAGNSQTIFLAANPGIWESYGGNANAPAVRDSNGNPVTGKRLIVKLTADGLDIADLTIEGV
jgi:hypothetical protein